MQHTEFEEINGDDVRVSVHPKPSCKIELHVKTSPFLVKKARKNAAKTVSKEVAIPGFRKGKAPQEIIEKKYPADLERALHKAIADLAFVQAQKAAKVHVLNNNSSVSFDLKNHSEDGAELVFSFETEPTVPAVDFALFQPKPIEKTEVGDKQIDEMIYQMRFFYATWESIERPVQEGDYILIDLDTREGEEWKQVFHHVRFEVSQERMAKWMNQLVIGAKTGDVLEGMSDAEEGMDAKNVRMTMVKVEAATLPPLDDEFAKKVGAQDVTSLRQSITKLLSTQADQKANELLREQVNDFLIQNYPFELPQSLLNAEIKHRFQERAAHAQFRKQWEQMSAEKQKQLQQTIAEEAESAVRIFYLSRKIIQDQNIPITHKEVQQMAVAIIQGETRQSVHLDQVPKETYALALSKVILAKAQDVILAAQKS